MPTMSISDRFGEFLCHHGLFQDKSFGEILRTIVAHDCTPERHVVAIQKPNDTMQPLQPSRMWCLHHDSSRVLC
jgi:hypothetical protein